MSKITQQIVSQESGIFSKSDLDKVQQYEYKGKVYIVGSSSYIRHVAALKAHVTRARMYISKKEKAHNAAVKAWETRRMAKHIVVSDMAKHIVVSDMPRGGR